MVQVKANEIIDTTIEQGLLSGKSPTGYAAAASYSASLLCSEKQTQREVAEVAHVTEVTIQNRYREQIKAMGLLMPPRIGSRQLSFSSVLCDVS